MATLVNIDVWNAGALADHGTVPKGRYITAYGGGGIRQVVQDILERLQGGGKIGRLRLVGHGVAPAGIILGGNKQPTDHCVIRLRGKELLNQVHLIRLHGCFGKEAVVEIHACQSASYDKTGDEVQIVRLCQRLAGIWKAKVEIGMTMQRTRGGVIDGFQGDEYIESDGSGAQSPTVTWKKTG